MQFIIPSIGFGLVTASILALAAVGFTMQFGVTSIFNLAYGDVMTASALVGYACFSVGIDIWICLVIGGIFGAVASFLLNRLLYAPFIRRGTKLFGMVVVTLAVSLIIQNIVLAIMGGHFLSLSLSSGATITLGSIVLTLSQVGIMGIAVAAMVVVHALLAYTKLGKAMRATSSNAALARSCGIRTDRIIDAVWLISGALCGMAGVTLVMNTMSFSASTGGDLLVVIIAAAILGGVGDAYGAMLGALTVGLATEITAALISPAYKDAVAFAILVVMLLWRPQGIRAILATQKEVVA